MKKVILALVLSVASVGVMAASTSHTTYQGTSYTNSISVGSSNTQASYVGGFAALEVGQGVISKTVGVYAGTDTTSHNYSETGYSDTSFSGTAVNNGLVGRSTEQSSTSAEAYGISSYEATGERNGVTTETSIVGGWFGGSIGGEVTTYNNSYADYTNTSYGSDVYSETYSTNSYNID